MAYSRQYPQNITPKGTSVQAGFENDDKEIKRILDILSNMGALSLAGTKRQSVLYGPTGADGAPNFLVATGLSISIDGSSKPIIFAFANGFSPSAGSIDLIDKVDSLVSSAWTLPPNQTCYLYIDKDKSTGLLSFGYTTAPDLYLSAAPASPVLDQHYFNTVEMKMYRYNSNSWEEKLRVFVGKAVTASSSISINQYIFTSRVPVTGSIFTDYVKKSGDTMTGNLNMDDSQERRIIGFTNNIGIYWNPDNIGAFDWNVQKPGEIWSYNKQNKIMTVNAQGGLHVDMPITLQDVSLMKNLAVADYGETKIYGYNSNIGVSFNGSKNFDIYDWKSNNKILHYDGGEISLGADREGVNTRLLIPHASQLVISKSSNDVPIINFANNQDSQGLLAMSNGELSIYNRSGIPSAFEGSGLYLKETTASGDSLALLTGDGKGVVNFWNPVDNKRGSLKALDANLDGVLYAPALGHTLGSLTIKEGAIVNGYLNVAGSLTINGGSLMKSLAVADYGETKIYGYNSNIGVSFNGSKNFDIYDWKSNNKILHYDGGEITLGADREGVNTKLLVPHGSQLVISKSSNEAPTINFANNQDSQGALVFSQGTIAPYKNNGTRGGVQAQSVVYDDGVSQISLYIDSKWLSLWNSTDNHRGDLKVRHLNAEGNIVVGGALTATELGHTLGSLTVTHDCIVNGTLSANLSGCAATLGRGGDNAQQMTFNWSGKDGQPTWLWGGDKDSTGTQMYVYNPANFNVNSVGGYTAAQLLAASSKVVAVQQVITWSGVLTNSGVVVGTWNPPAGYTREQCVAIASASAGNLQAAAVYTSAGSDGQVIMRCNNAYATTYEVRVLVVAIK